MILRTVGIEIHLYMNARYSRLKIRDHIRQAQSVWKGAELSSKSMVKGLHKGLQGSCK